MLHRLTLRVLPRLYGLVTEASVRKRKRLVMLAPGLVAFLAYRLLKLFLPLSDPFILLSLSGVFSSVTALWAYRMGRNVPMRVVFQEDGHRRLMWLVGWVGFAYGVQLSLLVLALLKLFVGYDFLLHPDGPAMMAMIIACTSVTRDAFEIGFVRQSQQRGQSILTFPDGEAFRRLVQMDSAALGRWTGLAMLIGVGSSLVLTMVGLIREHEVVHAIVASVLAGCMGNLAFWAGEQRSGMWWKPAKSVGWWELLQFWIWPCLTFSVTYYLVQAGMFSFLVRIELTNPAVQSLLAGTTTAMMASYGYYLGNRKYVESQVQQGVSEDLQRCPFVMGILTKAGVVSETPEFASDHVEAGQPERMAESQ